MLRENPTRINTASPRAERAGATRSHRDPIDVRRDAGRLLVHLLRTRGSIDVDAALADAAEMLVDRGLANVRPRTGQFITVTLSKEVTL